MALASRLHTAWSVIWTSVVLWLAGVRDALCLHRCVVFFVLEPRILTKTVNCFMLNGVVFLGSVLLLDYGLAPLVHMLLAGLLGSSGAQAAASALAALYHALWLGPAYALSLLVNCLWYAEIAELAAAAAQQRALQQRATKAGVVMPRAAAPLRVHRPDPLALASQEVYRAVLLMVLLLQATLLGAIPWIGPTLSFLLLSWLYALYCFDYKWSLHGVPLDRRVQYFEQHWAFFLGFGMVTVLPLPWLPFYAGAALAGLLFPLFILLACASNPKQPYQQVASWQGARGGQAAFVQLPIFQGACHATTALLRRLDLTARLLRLLGVGAAAAEPPEGGSSGAPPPR